ncbi:DUF2017 family protein [Verrucomicrobiales bacterium]|nr:DUF2017 family protein [Verrucomicrobiales bacterium]MDC0049127.1 DUF2017 family protein [Verrucomicrobiota bacterium]NCG27643.1 DUF2017 family protein [Verrucomicrobiales bacterium]|tara:strand:- start:51 stop:569 length:519 start_codon:yes stop_codon:yes gene_type:complete
MELINNDDGTWTLSKVSELEHLMLSRLPESADSTGCEEASNRLFPSPISPEAGLDNEKKSSADSDWKEYIEPELRVEFRDSLKIVADDLGQAQKAKDEEVDCYEFNIPTAHADHWCSALNQARIVIHYSYNLPDEDGVLDMDPNPEKWMATLQSEIYGMLMEFLIKKVLWVA